MTIELNKTEAKLLRTILNGYLRGLAEIIKKDLAHRDGVHLKATKVNKIRRKLLGKKSEKM